MSEFSFPTFGRGVQVPGLPNGQIHSCEEHLRVRDILHSFSERSEPNNLPQCFSGPKKSHHLLLQSPRQLPLVHHLQNTQEQQI